LQLLQFNRLDYHIATPFSLSQGNNIFFNLHFTNFEPNNGIKLINCSYNSIKIIEMIKPIINVNEALNVIPDSHDYKIDIFSVSSNYNYLKVDNEKEFEASIYSIGYNLTKENFVKGTINYLYYYYFIFNDSFSKNLIVNFFYYYYNIIKQLRTDDNCSIHCPIFEISSFN
jgi:hypothetical protein